MTNDNNSLSLSLSAHELDRRKFLKGATIIGSSLCLISLGETLAYFTGVDSKNK